MRTADRRPCRDIQRRTSSDQVDRRGSGDLHKGPVGQRSRRLTGEVDEVVRPSRVVADGRVSGIGDVDDGDPAHTRVRPVVAGLRDLDLPAVSAYPVDVRHVIPADPLRNGTDRRRRVHGDPFGAGIRGPLRSITEVSGIGCAPLVQPERHVVGAVVPPTVHRIAPDRLPRVPPPRHTTRAVRHVAVCERRGIGRGDRRGRSDPRPCHVGCQLVGHR